MLLLLLKLYAVQGLFVKYERAVGASSINTLWSSLINRKFFGNIWKTQEKMVRLIVITTVLSVFILLVYIPYVPSKDLNYNQGVETRRIIEQPPSEIIRPFMHAKVFIF